MAQDTKTRIDERTAIAEQRMQSQGAVGRIITKAGLFTANAVDAVTGWVDNDKTVFMGSTASGLMRGAIYGALIAIALIATFHIVALANIFFLAIAGVGAVGYGIYDGQKGLEHHLNGHGNPIPDMIAQTAGIVPEKSHTHHKEAERHEEVSNDPSFAAREEARRCAAASAVQR